MTRLPDSLPRDPDRPTSLDWAALREEGIAHIRALAGDVWTDHNTHDPGITALEVLCYALTDLAYRARLPVADLLTGPDGRIAPPERSGLFPAHEVLPTAPRTIADYRRLLMRVDGVRNAWFDPATPEDGTPEVALRHDRRDSRLTEAAVDAGGDPTEPVHLCGLYRVSVDIDDDPTLGPLNDLVAAWRPADGALAGAVLSLVCRDPALADAPDDPAAAITAVRLDRVDPHPDGYSVGLELTLGEAGTVTLDPCLVRVDRPARDGGAIADEIGALRRDLEDASPGAPVPVFWAKRVVRARVLARVRAVLHAHRGLCEDYLSIAPIATAGIGICADIDLHRGADLEAVQAAVFAAIDSYLGPAPDYRTLKEMLADGTGPEAIFNGPFIDPGFAHDGAPVFVRGGFLTDPALAACELRRSVHASDLINLIVDIDGVAGVRNLLLQAHDPAGAPLGPDARWRLDMPAAHRPVLSVRRSKLLFHKDGLPFRAQSAEFERLYAGLRLRAAASTVAADRALPVPSGRYRDPGAIYPVQHDFPRCYGIGADGLARSEPADRLAEARQFKAYLTLFEQVFADYLGQLAALPDLFGLDPALNHAWFPQFFDAAAGTLGDFPDEIYRDPSALSDPVRLRRLNESDFDGAVRRGAVLDHLIARFAESFVDHAGLQVRRDGDRLAAVREGIADRARFLREYPSLSRNRGQGANIRPEDPTLIWDSGNVSGLERRLARFIGIDPVARHDLHCADHLRAFVLARRSGEAFVVVLRGPDGRQVFRSRETFDVRDAAQAAGAAIHAAIRDRDITDAAADAGTGSWRLRLSAGGVTLTDNREFDGQDDAVAAARAIVDAYDALLHGPDCDREGMHLIEHILLRPRRSGDALMSLPPADCACGDTDPYSFRASLVLPAWPERFRDPAFRALVERTAFEECPAHVVLRICWIGLAPMRRLDIAHRAWLTALADADADALAAAAGDLIAVLAGLRSVHPPATLHDCDDGGDAGALRLGDTALGLF